MKKFALVLGLLVLASGSAFAEFSALERLAFVDVASNDPLPDDQAKAVREALLDVMNVTAFDCTSATSTYKDSNEGLKAIKDFVPLTQKVYVAASTAQPALKMTWAGSDMESTLRITTTADYKTIVSMQAVQESIGNQRVNTGTIVNPKWETRQTRKTNIEVSCKAKLSVN